MAFRVGMKVVCIDARRGAISHRHCPLKKGAVYTVLEIVETPWGNGVRVDADPDWSWLPVRFRPVVDKTTDIGFAHEILRKVSKVKETAA